MAPSKNLVRNKNDRTENREEEDVKSESVDVKCCIEYTWRIKVRGENKIKSISFKIGRAQNFKHAVGKKTSGSNRKLSHKTRVCCKRN